MPHDHRHHLWWKLLVPSWPSMPTNMVSPLNFAPVGEYASKMLPKGRLDTSCLWSSGNLLAWLQGGLGCWRQSGASVGLGDHPNEGTPFGDYPCWLDGFADHFVAPNHCHLHNFPMPVTWCGGCGSLLQSSCTPLVDTKITGGWPPLEALLPWLDWQGCPLQGGAWQSPIGLVERTSSLLCWTRGGLARMFFGRCASCVAWF